MGEWRDRRVFVTGATGMVGAWLVISVLESTVIVSWRTAQPWEGFQEAVVPLAFALWGLAAAPFMTRGPAGGAP